MAFDIPKLFMKNINLISKTDAGPLIFVSRVAGLRKKKEDGGGKELSYGRDSVGSTRSDLKARTGRHLF